MGEMRLLCPDQDKSLAAEVFYSSRRFVLKERTLHFCSSSRNISIHRLERQLIFRLDKRRTFLNHLLSVRIFWKTLSVTGNQNDRGSLILKISNQRLHAALSRLIFRNDQPGTEERIRHHLRPPVVEPREFPCLTLRPWTLGRLVAAHIVRLPKP